MSMPTSTQTATEPLLLAPSSAMPRVNLLPPEILEARRLRRTQVGLAFGLTGVLVALGAVFYQHVQDRDAAQRDLTAAQAQTATLQAAQAKYADVPRVVGAIDAAEQARGSAMANDVEWYRTLTNFSLTLPGNVWFTSLTVQVNGPQVAATTGTAPAAPTTATSPTAPTVPGPGSTIGTVQVAGTALDHPDVASWLDVLARQPGLADAYFSSSTKAKIGSKSVVNFTSTANITQDALSHRYDRKQG